MTADRRAEQVAEDLGPLDDDGLPVAQDLGEAAAVLVRAAADHLLEPREEARGRVAALLAGGEGLRVAEAQAATQDLGREGTAAQHGHGRRGPAAQYRCR
mgnify:CR=1 FL=1